MSRESSSFESAYFDLIPRDLEKTNITQELKLSNSSEELFLFREINFNGMIITAALSQRGHRIIYSDDFCLSIEKFLCDHYAISVIREHNKKYIDFCLGNHIIEEAIFCGRKKFVYVTPGDNYKVKFNESLKLDFSDTPDDVAKLFPTLYSEEVISKPGKMMFLDLELETI